MVIGILLFIALGAAAGSNVAWIGGVSLAIVGLWSLSSPRAQAGEWTEVVIGVLLFIAPWVLGFTAMTAMGLQRVGRRDSGRHRRGVGAVRGAKSPGAGSLTRGATMGANTAHEYEDCQH